MLLQICISKCEVEFVLNINLLTLLDVSEKYLDVPVTKNIHYFILQMFLLRIVRSFGGNKLKIFAFLAITAILIVSVSRENL